MLHKMLLSKIHRATVTEADPDYVGSITVDAELLKASGIRPNELVHVLDVDNAARFETYVIWGEPGSGVIGINGAAAKLVNVGDKVLILSYGLLTEDELDEHVATVVVADERNQPDQVFKYDSLIEKPADALSS